MFSYRIYGLPIRSEIEFPGADVYSGNAFDAEITVHTVPRSIAAEHTGLRFQLNRNLALYRVDHVASYLVENGERVVVEPAAAADPDAVRLFCLETAMPTLLAQREHLALRGSAVATSGGVLVFLGGPGAGKSTLAAALERKGYILTDGLCVLSPDRQGSWRVEAGLSEIRLWPDDLARIGLESRALPRARRQLEKRSVPISRPVDPGPSPIRHIYILRTSFKDEVELQSLDSSAAFTILQAGHEAASIVWHLHSNPVYLQLCLALATRAKISLVTRPRRMRSIIPLLEQIESNLLA